MRGVVSGWLYHMARVFYHKAECAYYEWQHQRNEEREARNKVSDFSECAIRYCKKNDLYNADMAVDTVMRNDEIAKRAARIGLRAHKRCILYSKCCFYIWRLADWIAERETEKGAES